ncbi:MAG: hypothetical protein CR217_17190 [Beijerinckiaceae bacterium]|nr:MAG: hypothetical protein CR217_17190 [Beijerinckiaceae bacterium]
MDRIATKTRAFVDSLKGKSPLFYPTLLAAWRSRARMTSRFSARPPDGRIMMIRQKISGGFRSPESATDFAAVGSFFSTHFRLLLATLTIDA